MRVHAGGRVASRRGPRAAGIGALVLVAATGAGCVSHTGSGDARLPQARSYSEVTGDPANRSRSAGEPGTEVALRWSRPLGAPLTGVASSPALDSLYQATVSESGCNLFALSTLDGRKRWCQRRPTDGPRITATVEGRGDVFVPERGGASAISSDGELRWVVPTGGSPTTLTLLDNRSLLVIDHLGVARVVNTQTGEPLGPILPLAGQVPGGDPAYGLPWCSVGTRGCPATGPAAVDTGSGTAYLTVWPFGARRPELHAVRFVAGDAPHLESMWTRELPNGRAAAPVVLSDDGTTLYVHGDDGALASFSTADGRPGPSVDLGYRPDFSPALLPDGTLVTGGRSSAIWHGPDDSDREQTSGPVVAVRPEGVDSLGVAWRRDDLRQLADPVATPGGRVWVAARSRDDGIALVALDGGDGHTVFSTDLPDARGPVSGLSVDASGRIAVSTSMGGVYVYRAPSD